MKKNTLLGILMLSVFSLFAQSNASKISLTKGQKLKMNSRDTSNISQKRGEEAMDMKSVSETGIEMEVLEVKDNGYLATVTLKSMKLDFDGYGQKMVYNSADAGKQEGPIAEQMKNVINKPDTVFITFEGKKEELEQKEDKKGKGGGKGRGGMMRMMNQSGANIENAFLLVPAEAKEGSGWKKDGTQDDVRSQTIYFVEKIEGNKATVSFKKKTKGSVTRSGGAMGEMKIDIDNLSSGWVTVELSTGFVKTYYESTNSNSKTNMGGQEMPSTGVVSSAVVFE